MDRLNRSDPHFTRHTIRIPCTIIIRTPSIITIMVVLARRLSMSSSDRWRDRFERTADTTSSEGPKSVYGLDSRAFPLDIIGPGVS